MYKYFVAYQYGYNTPAMCAPTPYSTGVENIIISRDKLITSDKDIHNITLEIKSRTGRDIVVIINFQLLS